VAPVSLRSTVKCGKTSTAVTFFKFEPLLPCDCYAIKTSIRTIRSQVLQPASAGNVADLVNCKLSLHDTRSVNRGSGAVWLSYRQIKLSLQELGQLSCWLQISKKCLFSASVSSKCPFCPPADAQMGPFHLSLRPWLKPLKLLVGDWDDRPP